MNTDKPLNKRLIIISSIILFFLTGIDAVSQPTYFEGPITLIIGVFIVLVAPLFALWIKALWNEIIPRITAWREIRFLETIGLMALLSHHLIKIHRPSPLRLS